MSRTNPNRPRIGSVAMLLALTLLGCDMSSDDPAKVAEDRIAWANREIHSAKQKFLQDMRSLDEAIGARIGSLGEQIGRLDAGVERDACRHAVTELTESRSLVVKRLEGFEQASHADWEKAKNQLAAAVTQLQTSTQVVEETTRSCQIQQREQFLKRVSERLEAIEDQIKRVVEQGAKLKGERAKAWEPTGLRIGAAKQEIEEQTAAARNAAPKDWREHRTAVQTALEELQEALKAAESALAKGDGEQ